MIWLEFRRPDALDDNEASNVVLEPGLLNVEVHTQPPVDGLTVTGTIAIGGLGQSLNFQAAPGRAGVYHASFEPPQRGVYQVTVTAGGGGYRDFTLSGELYCRW